MRVRAQQLIERQRDVGGRRAGRSAAGRRRAAAKVVSGRRCICSAMRSTPTAPAAQRVGRRGERQAGQPHALDLDRPQRDRAGGAEAAASRRAPVRCRAPGRPARWTASADPAGSRTARSHAGRHRRQVMRIQHAEQRVGQFGEFVVQPVMHARGEERHAFQQARDMRVVDRVGATGAAGRRSSDAPRRTPPPAGGSRPVRGRNRAAARQTSRADASRHRASARRDVGGGRIDQRVERDRLGRRVGVQQRLDAQAQRRRPARRPRSRPACTRTLSEARLEAADRRLDLAPQLLALAPGR